MRPSDYITITQIYGVYNTHSHAIERQFTLLSEKAEQLVDFLPQIKLRTD